MPDTTEIARPTTSTSKLGSRYFHSSPLPIISIAASATALGGVKSAGLECTPTNCQIASTTASEISWMPSILSRRLRARTPARSFARS